jgi:hypothetical protein
MEALDGNAIAGSLFAGSMEFHAAAFELPESA